MSIRAFKEHLPSLGEKVYIDEQAAVMGQVTLGNDCSVWPMTVIRGDVNTISVGEATNLQDHSVLHVTRKSAENPAGFPLVVGSHVTVGHRVTLHGCTIGDYCLIGMGAIVLDGAYLEEEVILGAGSLVSQGKRLEKGFLYVGAPAQKVRPLTATELEFLRFSAKHYVDLKNIYLGSWIDYGG